MKKIIVVAILLAFAAAFSTAREEKELGKRYIKLGISNIVLGDKDNAKKYLEKGAKIAKKFNDIYWEAVAEEAMGYYFLCFENDFEQAIKRLNKAKLLYDKVAKTKNGSAETLGAILDKIQYGSASQILKTSSFSAKDYGISSRSGKNLRGNQSNKLKKSRNVNKRSKKFSNNKKFRRYPNRLCDFFKDKDNAKKYPKTKAQIVEKFNDIYWEAVAEEVMGYYFLCVENDFEQAIKRLNKAKLLYDKVAKTKNGGAETLGAIIYKIQHGNADQILKTPCFDAKGDGISNKSDEISSKGDEISNKSDGNLILNLSNQKLKELPNVDKRVKNLILSYNRFRKFPEKLCDFKDLEVLDLSNNRLRNLPESVAKLKNLRFLNLENNKIRKLPLSLGKLKKLEYLNLKGNDKIPIEQIINLVRELPNANIVFGEYKTVPRKP